MRDFQLKFHCHKITKSAIPHWNIFINGATHFNTQDFFSELHLLTVAGYHSWNSCQNTSTQTPFTGNFGPVGE